MARGLIKPGMMIEDIQQVAILPCHAIFIGYAIYPLLSIMIVIESIKQRINPPRKDDPQQ